MTTSTTPTSRRWRPWVPFAVLAVIGLAAGVISVVMGERAGAMPEDCDDVIVSYHAEALLRTSGSVSPRADHGDEMLTCTWRTEGDEDDGTRRASSLTVSVAEHPWFGADPSVEQVRTYADLESKTTPVGLGDEAIAVSAVKGGIAHAEVGVHDGPQSIRVVYTVDDGDRAMTAYLAEVAARTAVLGGPQL